MYNFVMLHELWMVITIGVIRGFRKGWPGLRDILSEIVTTTLAEDISTAWDEAIVEETKANKTYTPAEAMYEYVAIMKTKNVVSARINSGKAYKSMKELIDELEGELEFQRIAVREGIKHI